MFNVRLEIAGFKPPVIFLLAVPRRLNYEDGSNSVFVATCPSIPAARFAFRLFYSFSFSCS